MFFKTGYRLMQVRSIAECSNGAFGLLPLRPLFCLFLSGRLRQGLLYLVSGCTWYMHFRTVSAYEIRDLFSIAPGYHRLSHITVGQGREALLITYINVIDSFLYLKVSIYQ